MNSDLYGKTFVIPQEVLNYLEKCFEVAKNADKTTEGYKRNIELRNTKEVSYQQLKRMKNWFDSFKGTVDDATFILNGGDYVKNWVNNILETKRNDVDLGKEIKSVVLPNQYNDTHEKDNIVNLNRPSKSHNTAVHEIESAINENLKRINDLIKKII